jgi:hypothetical protein
MFFEAYAIPSKFVHRNPRPITRSATAHEPYLKLEIRLSLAERIHRAFATSPGTFSVSNICRREKLLVQRVDDLARHEHCDAGVTQNLLSLTMVDIIDSSRRFRFNKLPVCNVTRRIRLTGPAATRFYFQSLTEHRIPLWRRCDAVERQRKTRETRRLRPPLGTPTAKKK